jgi:hypothetical protein
MFWLRVETRAEAASGANLRRAKTLIEGRGTKKGVGLFTGSRRIGFKDFKRALRDLYHLGIG